MPKISHVSVWILYVSVFLCVSLSVYPDKTLWCQIFDATNFQQKIILTVFALFDKNNVKVFCPLLSMIKLHRLLIELSKTHKIDS